MRGVLKKTAIILLSLCFCFVLLAKSKFDITIISYIFIIFLLDSCYVLE